MQGRTFLLRMAASKSGGGPPAAAGFVGAAGGLALDLLPFFPPFFAAFFNF